MKKLNKLLLVCLLVLTILPLVSCNANDPITDNLYIKGNLYVWDGTTWVTVNTLGGGDVTATANLADNKVIRGDGGGKGIQDSLCSINDFGTLYAPAYTGQNLQLTGKLEGDRLYADVEGYSIDVVQASDLSIALNDTLDITFLFVPDVIVLSYTGRCQHDVTYDDGHTTGHSLVTITGVDAMTCNNNYTALVNNSGAFGSHIGQNDNVNSVVVFGGNDGVDDAYFYGVGNWTTVTKTLRLTFSTVANTRATHNYIEIMAIAYR